MVLCVILDSVLAHFSKIFPTHFGAGVVNAIFSSAEIESEFSACLPAGCQLPRVRLALCFGRWFLKHFSATWNNYVKLD